MNSSEPMLDSRWRVRKFASSSPERPDTGLHGMVTSEFRPAVPAVERKPWAPEIPGQFAPEWIRAKRGAPGLVVVKITKEVQREQCKNVRG